MRVDVSTTTNSAPQADEVADGRCVPVVQRTEARQRWVRMAAAATDGPGGRKRRRPVRASRHGGRSGPADTAAGQGQPTRRPVRASRHGGRSGPAETAAGRGKLGRRAACEGWSRATGGTENDSAASNGIGLWRRGGGPEEPTKSGAAQAERRGDGQKSQHENRSARPGQKSRCGSRGRKAGGEAGAEEPAQGLELKSRNGSRSRKSTEAEGRGGQRAGRKSRSGGKGVEAVEERG